MAFSTPESELAEQHRRAALANAIASGELEGIEYTPAMRDLLDCQSRGLLTEAEFAREAWALARSAESWPRTRQHRHSLSRNT